MSSRRILVGCGLILGATRAVAAPGDGVVAVSLFKNGFASVTREFALKGTSTTIEVPPASLGTLFFASDDASAVTVEAVPAAQGKRRIPIQSMGDLLRANVGREVVLRTDKIEALPGTVKSVGRDIATLTTPSGTLTLTIASIGAVFSAKGDLRLEVEVSSAGAVRSYRVTKSKPGGRVRLTSLEPGLSWVPTYRIDLSDPKTATVVAGSTIFNHDYDLKEVRARLVTGFPAARYRNVPDPLVTRTALPEWLAAFTNPEAQPPLRRDVAAVPGYGPLPDSIDFISYDPTDNSLIVRNDYGAQSRGMGGGFGGMGGGMGGMGGGQYGGVQQGGGTGEAVGELFFYEIPPLTLAKGVRRAQSLFQFDAPYRHVNTFEIGPDYDENLNPIRRNQSDNSQNTSPYYYGRRSEEDERALREAVWHEIELENRAGQPLTGAVGAIVEKEELIGQSMVDYTPPGGQAIIRLDRALDLVLDRKEEVILREPGAVKSTRYTNTTYDRITIRGTITVRNPRKEPVILKGRKRTFGEMTLATPNGKITKTEALLNGLNGSSVAEYEVTIAPGATTTLMYTYLLLIGR